MSGYTDRFPSHDRYSDKTEKRDHNGRTDQRAFERVQPGLQNGHQMLMEDGSKEKEPGMMASAFSKMTTEMKLMMKDDSSQVAKLVMDGCNMGIQTLGGYINEYKNASGQSMNLARDIVRTEESLMKDVQKFL